MPSQRSDLQHSAVVVIDMANDFVYSGGVIADAGGPDYQQRAQRLIAALGRLLAAARRQAVGTPRSSPASRLSPAISCSANRLTARS